MATTTNRAEVTFNGRHVTEKHGRTTKTIPVDAVTSVEFTEYTWATKPGWDRDAKYCLKIAYEQPTPQWDGASYVPMTQGLEWRFAKSQGAAATSLYRAILATVG